MSIDDQIDQLVRRRYALDADPLLPLSPEESHLAPLVARLGQVVPLEDTSDFNDTVCFTFAIKGAAGIWLLQLSLLGPYATLVRPASDGRPGQGQLVQAPAAGDIAEAVVPLLRSSGITLATREMLEREIPFEVEGLDNPVTVYRALFEDFEAVPWSTDPAAAS